MKITRKQLRNLIKEVAPVDHMRPPSRSLPPTGDGAVQFATREEAQRELDLEGQHVHTDNRSLIQCLEDALEGDWPAGGASGDAGMLSEKGDLKTAKITRR